MVDRIYSFLGLATKAGKEVSGEETCERALKAEKVCLVIVSADASENTRKKFKDMCSYRNVPIRFFGQRDMLGRFSGKEARTVVAVTDPGFAGRLQEMIDGCGKEHGGV